MIQKILLGLILIPLLFACITDLKSKEVYRFTWWIAIPPSFVLLGLSLWQGKIEVAQVLEWMFYCILQEFLFCKLYGRADCHGYCICGLVLTAFGGDFVIYLGHMGVSLILLTLVQAFRGNINSKGNLKESVAFLPYITLAFLLVLCYICNYSEPSDFT